MLRKHTKHILYIIALVFLLFLIYTFKNVNLYVRITGTIIAIFSFYLTDFFFELKFKKHHYIILISIAILGILFSSLYFLSTNYDKILHILAPIFISIIIFFLINKLKTTFSIKLLLTLSVVISLLALFEIGEYALDQIMGWELQGVYLRDYTGISKLKIIMNKNDDTMIDLMFGTLGSLFFVLIKTITFNYKKYF